MAIYLYLSLAGVTLALGGTAAVLIWLWRRLWRLERQFHEYRQAHEGFGHDLADLRAAAARTDERVGELAVKLKELGTRLKEHENQASAGELVYQTAIERIHQGADVEELVGSLGCSREEAALLIRLHCLGSKAYFKS